MVSAGARRWAGSLIRYLNGEDGARGGPIFAGTQQPIGTDWWVWGWFPHEEPDGTLTGKGQLNPAQYRVWSRLLPVRHGN
jgi:hypothetical protein